MLINLFNTVKSSGVPCSLRELLDLIGALEARIAYSDMNDFYYLSRAILVKDEKPVSYTHLTLPTTNSV